MFKSKKQKTSQWFKSLRDKICEEFERIELEFAEKNLGLQKSTHKFKKKNWNRSPESQSDNLENSDFGGGEMSFMRDGQVFESVAVNYSAVYGDFPDKLFHEIKKNQDEFSSKEDAKISKSPYVSKKFYATGISLIAHMQNPNVPAVHFNTRFIISGDHDEYDLGITNKDNLKTWFGGGYDLTPLDKNQDDYDFFHGETKECCERHDPNYYTVFKKQCDEYFYLPHRKEPRGIGGIFYDYLNSGNFEKDFDFTKDVGLSFLKIYSEIVRRNMFKNYTDQDRERLFLKRGRYVEFNLLYDRGTRFGLLTGGNTHSILSSLPPIVKWENEGFD